MRLLVSVLISTPAWATRSGVTDRILWGIPEWPPYSEAPSKNKAPEAIINRLLKALTDRMPSFDHEFIQSSVPKATELWQSGEDICSPIALYTKERAAVAYMTPWVLTPPLEVVTRAAKKELMVGDDKYVRLDKLLKGHHWRGVFVRNRSYGPPVDEELQSIPEEKLMRIDPPQGTWMSVLNMIASGRADYTVEFPPITNEFNKTHSGSEMLANVPIAGYTRPFYFTIACTRSDRGKVWIENIEKALADFVKTEEFHKSMEQLFSPDAQIQYRKDFQEFYERRKRGSWLL